MGNTTYSTTSGSTNTPVNTMSAEDQFNQWLNSQSGYVGKTKKQQWWDNYNNSQQAQSVMEGYNTNPLGSVILPQNMEVASNLSQVGALTGQNIGDIGRTSKQYQDLIQSRLSGSDENSRYLQQQRNRNMADVSRAYSGRKVAGGATLASANEARQNADSSINRPMLS